MDKAKRNLLRFIMEIGFSIDDLALFLDTHPEDGEALNYYNSLKKEYSKAVWEYENRFGPLSYYNVNSENKWTWTEEPWPWEGV